MFSMVVPLHITWGITGTLKRCWMAAAMAMVPGRRRTRRRSSKPLGSSRYTYSVWWVVMLMKSGP